jgi:HD superfamily phosphohydrolase
MLANSGSAPSKAEGISSGLTHEDVGKLILEHDPHIDKALRKGGVNKASLLKVFSKSDPDSLTGIISSDLDCDRLDYLRRTAHAGGVPYGEVDSDFIISKATLDDDGLLCFQSKAATAIDHFLVSRFYDWMQVVYHKTVVGLEWSLQIGIIELLERKLVDFSQAKVLQHIQGATWPSFDDSLMLAKFKELHERVKSASGLDVLADHLEGILFRRPAKEVFLWESIAEVGSREPALMKRVIEDELAAACGREGIDRNRVCLIWRKPFEFSSQNNMEEDYGERARSVNIIERNESKSSLLINRKQTLVHQMKGRQHHCVRVMYLPRAGESKAVRERIRSKLSTAAKAI